MNQRALVEAGKKIYERSGRKGPFHLVRVGSPAAYCFRRTPQGGDMRLIR